jgi:hypothetical protein
MKSLVAYVGAAFLEIAGCFAVWAWIRLGASPWWLVPGALALAAFAFLLTLIEVDAAGRAYAAYGGIYDGCRRGGGAGRLRAQKPEETNACPLPTFSLRSRTASAG